MLPRDRRLRFRCDFQRLSQADKARTSRIVMYAVPRNAGPTRLGLAVGKQVGNAVTRHRVSRMIRHAFHDDIDQWDSQAWDVMIRALPPSAETSFPTLLADMQQARRELQRKIG